MLPWSHHPWQAGPRPLMCHMVWWLSRRVALRGISCKMAFPNMSSSKVPVFTFHSHSTCCFPSCGCSQEFVFVNYSSLSCSEFSPLILYRSHFPRAALNYCCSCLSHHGRCTGLEFSLQATWGYKDPLPGNTVVLHSSSVCNMPASKRPKEPRLLPRTVPTTVTMAKRG